MQTKNTSLFPAESEMLRCDKAKIRREAIGQCLNELACCYNSEIIELTSGRFYSPGFTLHSVEVSDGVCAYVYQCMETGESTLAMNTDLDNFRHITNTTPNSVVKQCKTLLNEWRQKEKHWRRLDKMAERRTQ